MARILENPLLQLVIDSDAGTGWSLNGTRDMAPQVRGGQLGASYRVEKRRSLVELPMSQAECGELGVIQSPHGLLHFLPIRFGTEKNGLSFSLDFALHQTRPMLLWRLKLKNKGHAPVHIDALDMFKSGRLELKTGKQGQSPDLAFLSNGWQSWSHSGIYSVAERQRRTRLRFLQEPPNTNPETNRTHRAGHFSSEMFAVLGERKSRTAILAGFLSQRQHFGSLEAWGNQSGFGLHMWANGDQARLESGSEITTDWACLAMVDVDEADPLGMYVETVAQEHALKARARPILTGWCSWYQYFQNIDPAVLRSNLEAVKEMQGELPLKVVLIDDGFEAQVGDWLAFKPAFPQGVAPLAAEIRSAGLTPGLWLAPFIVHPKSKLVQEHPDWLLRGRLNRPVNAGYFWNTFPTALDMTHPGAQDYVGEVIQAATRQWGFSYLKLDFLFAAAIPGRRSDPTKTRPQVLRAALEGVRAAAGEETELLGCGCPLGPAIGLVDAMRISCDVDTRWTPGDRRKTSFLQVEPHIPSVRNALQNVLSRAALHGRWWTNDPDCLLLRPESHLTIPEIQTLASVIAMSGGPLFLSDDLPALPPERLRIAESLLPLIDQPMRIPDWLDFHTPRHLRMDLENGSGRWHLLALINWENQAGEMALDLTHYGLDPRQRYHVREFWGGTSGFIEDGLYHLGNLPAHATALCAVRPISDMEAQYVGSDLHVSQGLEVNTREILPGGLRLSIQRPGRVRGNIWIRLPNPPLQVYCNGLPVQYTLSEKICRIQVDTKATAAIQLDWGIQLTIR